jgi:hypothetical protein
MWVEAWAPEYGSSFEMEGVDPASAEPAGEPVEGVPWAAVAPERRAAPPLAFLDGVSRVDARVVLETGGAPAAGLCGSVGVGTMLCGDSMSFGQTAVQRCVVFGDGENVELPHVSAVLDYVGRPAPGSGPEDIRRELERFREAKEAALAVEMANRGWLVIADGRMRQPEPMSVIGYIKSHNARYLGPQLESLVPRLESGERTPVFVVPRSHTYSWYLCLSPTTGGSPWAGVARCEVSASLPLSRAVEMADLTACHLPRFASKEFWDTRSPQNLVPIATLERRLWHLLGDRQLVLRRIRSAVARERVTEPFRA